MKGFEHETSCLERILLPAIFEPRPLAVQAISVVLTPNVIAGENSADPDETAEGICSLLG